MEKIFDDWAFAEAGEEAGKSGNRKIPRGLKKFYQGREKCQFCGGKAALSTKIKKRWFFCKKCHKKLAKLFGDITKKREQLGVKLVFPEGEK